VIAELRATAATFSRGTSYESLSDDPLAQLVATLEDIFIGDLMDQVQEIQDILGKRRG
jgi:hypothetical protein